MQVQVHFFFIFKIHTFQGKTLIGWLALVLNWALFSDLQ